MPDIKYPKNSNSDTVFVEDGGQRTRAVKTVQPDGTIDYPKNPNSDSCYVTVDGEKQRALMVADISSAGTVEYPNNPNSTKGYVDINGKKQRVTFTANIAGGGSAPVIDELNVTPSTSAQTITASGGVDGYSPVNVSAVDASIDANIIAGNIKDGVTILGVTGNVVELNGETKTVTPQVYGQTLYPTAPKNAITEITVNAVTSSIDANIQAGNIKDGVQILGVTGNYTGGGSSTKYGLSLDNFLADATGGTLGAPTQKITNITLTGVKTISSKTLAYLFYQKNNFDTNGWVFSAPDLELIESYALQQAFNDNGAKKVTSISMPKLRTIYEYGLSSAFEAPTISSPLLTIVDLSSVESLSMYALGSAFKNQTALQKVYLTGLTSIVNYALGRNTSSYAFQGCTGITEIHFPAAMQTTIEGLTGYSDKWGATNATIYFDS